MPPQGVSPAWEQTDNGRTSNRALMCFLQPSPQVWSIWRIGPANPFPRLAKRIRPWRNEPLALCVVRQRGHVEREVKLRIERGVKFGRRFPFIAAVPESNGLLLAFALSVSSLLLGIRAVNSGAGQGSLYRNKTALRYAVSSPRARVIHLDNSDSPR
jgi:hypothetical protein